MPEFLQSFSFVYLWLILLVIFVIAEAATANLVTIWFALGAFVALIVSLFNVSPWICFTVFILVSALTLLITRPIVRKRILPAVVPTNSDSVIGEVGIVDETIDNINGSGYVLISGISWKARSSNDTVIEKGNRVIVDRIEGVKVYCHSEENN